MKTLKTAAIAILVILLCNPVIGQNNNSFSSNDDDQYTSKSRKKYRWGTRHDFSVDLGINNWLEDGEFPNDNDAIHSVRPWGSWYVGLNLVNDTHVAGPLHLEWGIGVNWYNFKFEDDATRLMEGDNEVIFSLADPAIDSEKSKLTASYLNASLVPVFKLGGNRRNRNRRDWGPWNSFSNDGGVRIGAGVYAGYKLGSYTKVNADDDKDRERDGFYLESIRYGVRAQIGFRGVDIFANYDLNNVFVSDRNAPELNAFSFGVIL